MSTGALHSLSLCLSRCISHLNQHHHVMKVEFQEMIGDAKSQALVLEQGIDKMSQQRLALDRFYENEIKHLKDRHDYLVNLAESKSNEANCSSFTFDDEDNRKQLHLIKHDTIPFLQSVTVQVDQILRQQHNENPAVSTEHYRDSKEEIEITLDPMPTIDTEMAMNGS